jgi:hypothetical protein
LETKLTLIALADGAFAVPLLLSIGSAVFVVLRKAERARQLAGIAMRMIAVLSVMFVAALVVDIHRVAAADATSKATMLARGISETMNCTALAFPTLMIAGAARTIAGRRLRDKNKNKI